MNKLKSFDFYPSDWIKGTRSLTPAEKGVWIDLLAYMWESRDRGAVRGQFGDIARMLGWEPVELAPVVQGLINKQILDCDVDTRGWFRDERTMKTLLANRERSGVSTQVTLMSRKMVEAENKRESARIRKQKERIRTSHGEVETDTSSLPLPSKNGGSHMRSVTNHIVSRWEAKKHTKYPFHAKHGVLISKMMRWYGAGGVMALWDVYLAQADDFTRSRGYSIEVFYMQVTRLVDDRGWKEKGKLYQAALDGAGPGEAVTRLAAGAIKNAKEIIR